MRPFRYRGMFRQSPTGANSLAVLLFIAGAVSMSVALILSGCATYSQNHLQDHQLENQKWEETIDQPAPVKKMAYEFEVQRDLAYVVRDQQPLLGDFYLPAGQGPFPTVLLVHGGSWAGGARWHMKIIATRLARNGFAVFNITYRLAPKHVFPAQLEDCQAAVRFLREGATRLRIDPNNIGVWGYSAGAHLAALLGTSTAGTTDAVQAVVAGSGPHDFTLYPSSPAIVALLGKTFSEEPALYKTASPVFQVTPATPPMFLYHGTGDMVVDPEHTRILKRALDSAGVRAETYMVSGLGHISLFVLGLGTERHGLEFLTRELKVR